LHWDSGVNLSLFFTFLLTCLLSFSFGLPSNAATPRFGKTKIGGISLSGLSPATAKMRLLRGLSKKLDYRYKISDGKRAVYRKRRQLGVYLAVDSMLARAKRGDKYVPVLFDVKASHLQKALTQLKPRFAVPSRPARVGEQRGKVIIIPEQNQRTLNVAASTKNVLHQLTKNPGTRVLKVQSSQKSPALTKARLKGINARLGSYSTRFNAGNVKRTTNLKLGIKAINGTLLGPNEVFSLNKAVGERTQARGYRTSIVFQNGYKVPGIGAGISQVTGTLFNAALLSGLPIVSYRTHSRPVAYIPVGRDATVAWGGFDMKFKNNTGAPIYIAYKTQGNRAIATLYGAQKARPDKVTLKVSSKKINAREIKAQLYRVMRHNGKLIKQKIGNSHYKWKVGAWEE
jgi:vancomycin resistance protein YoaR